MDSDRDRNDLNEFNSRLYSGSIETLGDRIRKRQRIETPINDDSDSESNAGDFSNEEDDPSYDPQDWDSDDYYQNRTDTSHIFESIRNQSGLIDESTVHQSVNAPLTATNNLNTVDDMAEATAVNIENNSNVANGIWKRTIREEISYDALKNLCNSNKVEQKRRSEISTSTSKRSKRITSDVWDSFVMLVNRDTNSIINGWVQCVKCNRYTPYNGSTTTRLKSHRCDKPQRNLMSFYVSSPSSPSSALSKNRIQFSKYDKDMIREAGVKFVAKDIRPFYAIEGEGLIDLCASMVMIGQNYPNIRKSDIVDLLPSRQTLRRFAITKATITKTHIAEDLHKALRTVGSFSSTMDTSTSRVQSITYLTITAKINIYENNCVTQKEFVLSADAMRNEQITGANIRQKVDAVYNDLGITDYQIRHDIVWITDRGSNVKNALADCDVRLNCFAHIINNIVKKMCEESTVRTMITNASSLVKYMKKSGYSSNELTEALFSHSETRWNVNFFLLKSVHNNYNAILDILRRKEENGSSDNCIDKITPLKKSELKQTMDVLELFAELTKNVQGEQYETLHLIWPYLNRIEKHLAQSPIDCPFIAEMKKKGRDYMAKNAKQFAPNILHEVAVFLHPAMKHLGCATAPERTRIYEYVRKEISEIYEQTSSIDSTIASNGDRAATAGSRDNAFGDFISDTITTSDEVGNYISLVVPPIMDILHFKLVEWWFEHRLIFPKLFKLFLKISSITSTSTPSERSFSTTGNTVTNKRSSLHPTTVDSLILIRNEYKCARQIK